MAAAGARVAADDLHEEPLANLYQIAEPAEEWISSEEGIRLSRPTPPARNVYLQGAPPPGTRRDPVFAPGGGLMPAPPVVG